MYIKINYSGSRSGSGSDFNYIYSNDYNNDYNNETNIQPLFILVGFGICIIIMLSPCIYDFFRFILNCILRNN